MSHISNVSVAIEPARFRKIMSKFATGVTIVTTRSGAAIHGLTVNAFCSLSLEPPLVLICIDKQAQGHEIIASGECFAVNFLTNTQAHLSDLFANNDATPEQRFAQVQFHQERTGAPILEGTLGWIDCRVRSASDGGDHTIFVGEVLASGINEAEEPLLYFDSGYHRLEIRRKQIDS